ncbi:MAG: ribbon-helix-helix protein, CopG family [Byssovorax sp.]
MSDLVRFGVAMDRALLAEFDQRIAARGYENRSEALRDLVRADLTRAAWDSGAPVIATLTLVYGAEARAWVAEIAGEEAEAFVTSTRVPLDGGRTLEVVVVRGTGAALGALAGRLGGARGVERCGACARRSPAPSRAALAGADDR